MTSTRPYRNTQHDERYTQPVTDVQIPSWSEDVLLAVAELSHALGYGQRAGVANLRDRKADFPGPAEGEGRSGRYRLSDVLEWFHKADHPLPQQPEVLPFITRVVRRRLGTSADVDALRRAVAWVAAEVGGAEPGDLLEQAYASASEPIGELLRAVREEEAKRPLLQPAIELHGLEAVVEAALTEGARTSGGKASFSDTRLVNLVVRVAERLGTFDVVADPCVGEGALAVAVARAVGASKLYGEDSDPTARAIFELRCQIAKLGIIESVDGSALVVCDAPLRDPAHDWIRRSQAFMDEDSSAIAVVEAATFGEREAHADLLDLLEAGELVAAVRLPDAMKGHGRVPGQALVVMEASKKRSHVVIADHRGATFEPPSRSDRGSAALEESLRSLDVEPGALGTGAFESFEDFSEAVASAVFDPRSKDRVRVDEIRTGRRDDLWLDPDSGRAARQMDEITSSLEEAVRTLRLIADLAGDPSRAPEVSGSRRMFERALEELRGRVPRAEPTRLD